MKKIISAPCSPSTQIDSKSIEVVKIIITFGGGMGGANQTFYANRVDKTSDGMLSVETVDGRKLELNPRYIVSKEVTNILKVVTDTTEHSNYHEKTCKYSERTEFFDVGFDSYEFASVNTSNAEKPVLSFFKKK
jgi:hypothetical protein